MYVSWCGCWCCTSIFFYFKGVCIACPSVCLPVFFLFHIMSHIFIHVRKVGRWTSHNHWRQDNDRVGQNENDAAPARATTTTRNSSNISSITANNHHHPHCTVFITYVGWYVTLSRTGRRLRPQVPAVRLEIYSPAGTGLNWVQIRPRETETTKKS